MQKKCIEIQYEKTEIERISHDSQQKLKDLEKQMEGKECSKIIFLGIRLSKIPQREILTHKNQP
jgi:hypothetical protein